MTQVNVHREDVVLEHFLGYPRKLFLNLIELVLILKIFKVIAASKVELLAETDGCEGVQLFQD
jgi:hypothetical protein